MPQVTESPVRTSLASVGIRLSDWFERWFPDAFALALGAVAIIYAASVATGSSIAQTAQWFGAGFWDLVAFTMQMSMIIVTGASVPAVRMQRCRKRLRHDALETQAFLAGTLLILGVVYFLVAKSQQFRTTP